MAMVTRETSGLELVADVKGKLAIFHNGVKLPCAAIDIAGGVRDMRSEVKVTFMLHQMTVRQSTENLYGQMAEA